MDEEHRHEILLIDDEDLIRSGLAELLRLDGYDVVEAADGAKALRDLEAGLRPCLVLLDLNMPGVSGWQFRALQLRNKELAEIPVVVLSGHGGISQQASTLMLSDFVAKPVDFDKLIRIVERTCRRSLVATLGVAAVARVVRRDVL